MENMLQKIQDTFNNKLKDLGKAGSNSSIEIQDIMGDISKYNNMSEDEQFIICKSLSTVIEGYLYDSGVCKEVADIIDNFNSITTDPTKRPVRFDVDINFIINNRIDNSNWLIILGGDIYRHPMDKGTDLDFSIEGLYQNRFTKLPDIVSLSAPMGFTINVDVYAFEDDYSEEEY